MCTTKIEDIVMAGKKLKITRQILEAPTTEPLMNGKAQYS